MSQSADGAGGSSCSSAGLRKYLFVPKAPLWFNTESNSSQDEQDKGDRSPLLSKKYPVMIISSSESESEGTTRTPNHYIVKVPKPLQNKKENVAKESTGTGTVISIKETVKQESDLQSGSSAPVNGIKRKKRILNGKGKKKKKKSKNESDSGSGDDAYLHRNIYNSDVESDEEERDNVVITKRRQKVLKLLNEGTEDDLKTVSGVTPSKLQIILKHRPYTNWSYTVHTFSSVRGLSASMLNSLDNIIVAKNIVNNLMKKCEQVAKNTEKIIASGRNLVTEPPKLINPEMKLTSYQMIGLNWLAIMHNQSLNSILADEMGLGKTIQIIAFLAYLKQIGHVVKDIPHLIVVPASTLNNWREELELWCPSLKVAIYHGAQEERRFLRFTWVKQGFGDIDIVLTTYTCVTKSYEEKKMFRIKEFNYIIYDEAHMLKNMNSQRYEALLQFNGNYKILLTGTPLQNNLLELMSLLIFLLPDMFETKTHHIKLLFSKGAQKEGSVLLEQEQVEQAKRIIDPFMLRRLKCDVLRDLPQKTSELLMCPMLEHQALKYKRLTGEFKDSLQVADSDSCMTYYMMLRKLANHPLLLRYHFTEDKLQAMAHRLAFDQDFKGSVPEHIKEDLYFKSDYELHTMCDEYLSLVDLGYRLSPQQIKDSGKLAKMGPLFEDLKRGGHRVLIFSQFLQMLDLLGEFLTLGGYKFFRLDGSTPISERQDMINEFNGNDEIFAFLLSTKAGGLGINLTAADTVIIHDMDFNPYNDKQAEDRCHRVGQTRPVKVYKLVSEDTIEERIYQIAQQKLHLERKVTSISAQGEDETTADIKTIAQMLKESLGIASAAQSSATSP